LALGTLAATAACGGDRRVDSLVVGMPRDSALFVLTDTMVDSTTWIADSLPRIWRATPYFTDGQRIEIVWYSPSGEKRTPADTVPDEEVIPIVFIDGAVHGYGESALNGLYGRYRLPQNRY
jgi:hypothetical protein